MALNSQVRCAHNNNYNPQKFLRGSPTKTSLPLSNAVVVNFTVDNDSRYPPPINTAPDPATSQEWNDFRAGFDNFLIGFVKFHDKYGPSTNIQADKANTHTCSIDGDDDSK